MRAVYAGFIHGARNSARSPGPLLLVCGFLVIVLTVMTSLWGAALSSHGGSLGGYDRRSLLWYVLCAQAAVAGVRARTIEEIGDEIGSGEVLVALLRPASVVLMRIALQLGDAVVRISAVFVVDGCVTYLLVGAPPSPLALLIAFPSALLGCVVNTSAQTAFGGIAFWLRDAKAAWFLYQKLVFLPGGMLIPLELLPVGLASVAHALPFAAMAYVPGRLGAGYISWQLLLTQVGWAVVAVATAVFVFARGERRLVGAGG